MPFLQVHVSILGQKLVALSRGFAIMTCLRVCWLWKWPDAGYACLQLLRMCTASGLLSHTLLWCSSVVHVEVLLPPVEKHQSRTLVIKKNTIIIYKFCLEKYFSSTNAVKALPM